MLAKKICLRAVMTYRDGKSIWTGEYACSICGLRFRPDPTDPANRVSRTSAVIDSGVLVFREGLETILVLAAITASFTTRVVRSICSANRNLGPGTMIYSILSVGYTEKQWL